MDGDQAYADSDAASDQPAAQSYVVETTSVIFTEPAPSGSVLADPRLVFLGPDRQGVLLEVMAIQTDDGGLLIIHAQPIRERYLRILEGGL